MSERRFFCHKLGVGRGRVTVWMVCVLHSSCESLSAVTQPPQCICSSACASVCVCVSECVGDAFTKAIRPAYQLHSLHACPGMFMCTHSNTHNHMGMTCTILCMMQIFIFLQKIWLLILIQETVEIVECYFIIQSQSVSKQ